MTGKVTQEQGTSRLVRQIMLESMDLETWLPGKVMEIHGSIHLVERWKRHLPTC